MPAGNAADRFGSVSKTFHWLTVVLIFTVIPLGIIANDAPFGTSEELARKALLFSVHKTLGVTIFLVALARILWAISQPKPAGLHPERRLETFLADLVHWLLYGSVLLVPLAGWVHHASTSGFAPIWWPFGQSLPLVPKSETLSDVASGLHIVLERVLVVAILLHVAGALKHHFIDKDDTLRRMMPGETRAGTAHTSKKYPALAGAIAVWIIAIGIGAGLGAYGGHSSATPQTEQTSLDAVQSEWTVQQGEIAITVTQFGSQVTGTFADWTAEISFENGIGPGPHGAVLTVIDISSLTLGSVTDQAMGPDFFDESAHPTAVFKGDILNQADGFEVRGALTLRGQTVPIILPFRMDVQDNTADVEASVTLDRRDFGIGDNLGDESSLAFSVNVNIALSATRP